MTPVFLDTVGLVAMWNRSDQWHPAAVGAFAGLLQRQVPLVTTSYVLLECANDAARRPYRGQVVTLRQLLSASGQLIEPTGGDVAQAWTDYERGVSGSAGIVDHVSFQVMRRLGVTEAFTNDKHFQTAGFTVLF